MRCRHTGRLLVMTLFVLWPLTSSGFAQAPFERHLSTATTTTSKGAPNAGRLDGSLRLPASGPGYVRRSRGNHYGTNETIALIHHLGAALVASYPDTAPLLIGDISAEHGGPLPPHRSHQSGRDVDIAFPEQANTARSAFNSKLTVDAIDMEKAWFALDTLITTGRVRFIFVHKQLLAPLRAEAKRVGWDDASLNRLFIDPRRRRGPGVVRHAPGHLAHFHVRFHCPSGDDGCSD